jgi:hypothetical protein
MVDFQIQYLTAILVMLSGKEIVPMVLQILPFRENIRHSRLETQWAGAVINKLWIKHDVIFFGLTVS